MRFWIVCHTCSGLCGMLHGLDYWHIFASQRFIFLFGTHWLVIWRRGKAMGPIFLRLHSNNNIIIFYLSYHYYVTNIVSRFLTSFSMILGRFIAGFAFDNQPIPMQLICLFISFNFLNILSMIAHNIDICNRFLINYLILSHRRHRWFFFRQQSIVCRSIALCNHLDIRRAFPG